MASATWPDAEAAGSLPTRRCSRCRLLAWKRHAEPEGGRIPIELAVVESPYRSVVPPVLAYVDTWPKAHPVPICTVTLPELVGDRWWAYWLHNHRAFWLKAALLSRSTVAVADVTYHLPPRGDGQVPSAHPI
jgi:hypothetical protein